MKKSKIKEGDILKSEWGYYVLVCRDEDKKLTGKLICGETNSCKNIPFALNNGEGYTKVDAIELARGIASKIKVLCSENAQQAASDDCRAAVNRAIIKTKW